MNILCLFSTKRRNTHISRILLLQFYCQHSTLNIVKLVLQWIIFKIQNFGKGNYSKVPPPKDMRFFYSKNLERVLRAEPLCREDCQIFKIFRCLQKNFPVTREIFKTLSASYEHPQKRCPWGGDFGVNFKTNF